MAAHETLHELPDLLSEPTKNMHRAIVSLIEELEAVDWYQQRAEACSDEELRGVLTHNKNEEIEHALMTLEWIRRQSPVFDEAMRTYLMKEGSILELEAAAESGGPEAADRASAPSGGDSGASGLGIGSLKAMGWARSPSKGGV